SGHPARGRVAAAPGTGGTSRARAVRDVLAGDAGCGVCRRRHRRVLHRAGERALHLLPVLRPVGTAEHVLPSIVSRAWDPTPLTPTYSTTRSVMDLGCALCCEARAGLDRREESK